MDLKLTAMGLGRAYLMEDVTAELIQVNTGLTTNGEGLTVNAFLTIIPNVVMTLALFAKRTVIPKLVTKLAFVIVLVLADAFQPIPGFSVSRWQRDTQVFINM